MPTVPFTKPPSGKELSQGELQEWAGDPMMGVTDAPRMIEKAAEILGGTVTSAGEVKSAAARQEAVKVDEELRKADPEDIKGFVRALLSKKRFTKAYVLFGSALTVTFQTRLVKENNLAREQANKLERHEQDKRYVLHKLAHSLVEIKQASGGNLAGKDLLLQDSYNLEPLFELNDVVYAAVNKAFSGFEVLCDLFYERAQNPDFWKKTAGGI